MAFRKLIFEEIDERFKTFEELENKKVNDFLQTAIREHHRDPNSFSREDMYQHFVGFFFNGYDTSAHVLLMVLYELAEDQ
jgi:cytochrome P450